MRPRKIERDTRCTYADLIAGTAQPGLSQDDRMMAMRTLLLALLGELGLIGVNPPSLAVIKDECERAFTDNNEVH